MRAFNDRRAFLGTAAATAPKSGDSDPFANALPIGRELPFTSATSWKRPQ